MKGCIRIWKTGLEFLLFDDLISFYAYFTTIFAEIAYLWAFSSNIALSFTILLSLCIVNVCVCSYLKGEWEGTVIELVVAIVYLLVFLIISIIGVFINCWGSMILIFFPAIISALWILFRSYQDSTPIGFKENSIRVKIFRLLKNKIIYVISHIIILGLPIIIFTVFLAMTNLPLVLKIIIPIVYMLISPLIAYMEDDFSACNIFEIAYDMTWRPE